MDKNELAAMAALTARFERLCQRAEQLQAALTEQVPVTIQKKVNDMLQTLSGQAGGAVHEGLEPAMDDYQRRLNYVTAEVEQTTKMLQVTNAKLASQLRRWGWVLGVIVALCLVSLGATYESLYGYYQTQYTQLKDQVNYLDAINRSDVALCGDGQLCARVDDKAPRYGDKKQYHVVAPRQ